MNTVSRLLTSVASAFEFNQATLSGCVDIIVVKQLDGTLKSTPFHVRFGKLKILKSKDKFVSIRINNHETFLRMKLGEAGEGFFEKEVVRDIQSNKKVVSATAMEIEETSQPGSKLYDALIMKEQNSSNGSNSSTKMINELSLSNSDSNIEIEDIEIGQDKVDDFFLAAETRQKSLTQPLQAKKFNSAQDINMSNSVNLEALSHNKNQKKIKVRTLRPSSEMLRSLNLKIGCNTVTYTVKSSLQGSQTVNGHIYFWPADANVIISDIDGTITKTDFLGHLMPMVGKDWSQPGIAPLYANIRRNGYHILYLTSRPIGQAKQTKEFLHSIYQDGKMLPHGPLVMSPDRMFPSVKREVIFKRPELFKMAVLKDIKSLFPEGHNPFHAGFGNRETDAIAYNSVGIPLEKVYIVNPKGDIHHHNDHPLKSYALINTMVKEMFPDILRDPKLKLAESLDEANALQIDDKMLMEENVAKVVS